MDAPKKRHTTWTKTQDNILKQKYASLGAKECAKFLPDKSLVSIKTRASRLGLNILKTWTPKEDDLLLRMRKNSTYSQIQALFPGRTYFSLIKRHERLVKRTNNR